MIHGNDSDIASLIGDAFELQGKQISDQELKDYIRRMKQSREYQEFINNQGDPVR